MLRLCRTFFPDYKVIFYLVYSIGPTPEMKMCSQTKSCELFASVATSCIVIRSFESTTPLMTSEEHKTHLTLAPMLTSWCWHMKMTSQIHSLIGSGA